MNREQWHAKRCRHEASPRGIEGMVGIRYPAGVFEISDGPNFGLAPANDAKNAGAMIHPIAGRDDAGSCCDWSQPVVKPR